MTTKEIIGIAILGLKNPLSKSGTLIIGFAVFLFTLFIFKEIAPLFDISTLKNHIKIGILVIPSFFVVLLLFSIRWISSFSITPVTIGVAIESGEGTNELLSETTNRIRRGFNSFDIPKLKVKVYPRDTVFQSAMQAENYLNEKGLTILIWGSVREGTNNGKVTYTFEIFVSHYIESLYPQDRHPKQISMEMGGAIKRNGWVVSEDNTENQLEIIKNNIVEIGLFSLGKCLAHLPSEKYQDTALIIFKKNIEHIKSWGNAYHERLNSLSQLIQETCDIYYKRGLSLMIRKKYKEAVVNFEKVREEGTQNENVLMNLAFCLWGVGMEKESKVISKKLWDENPGSPAGRFNLAYFAILNRQYKVAIKQYRLLNERGIGNINPLYTVEFLQNEYAINPNRHGLLFASGYVNYRWGDRTDSHEELQLFLSKTEGNSEYDVLRNVASGLLNN